MKLKKYLSVLLAVICLCLLLAACVRKEAKDTSETDSALPTYHDTDEDMDPSYEYFDDSDEDMR